MTTEAKLIAVIVLMIALAAGAFSVYRYGRHVEATVCTAAKEHDVEAANAKIIQLNDEARATEHKNAEVLAEIATNYEKEKQDEIIKRDTVIASLRSGTIRLRDKYAKPSPCTSTTSSPSTTTSGSNGTTSTELPIPDVGVLSTESSQFIVNLLNEADGVVIQLTACQKVVLEDREK